MASCGFYWGTTWADRFYRVICVNAFVVSEPFGNGNCIKSLWVERIPVSRSQYSHSYHLLCAYDYECAIYFVYFTMIYHLCWIC